FYRAVGKGNYSTIGYCRLSDPLTVAERHDAPLIFPQFDYESQGTEDPRIVKIDDLYYLSYTAYDGLNALGALAVSNDLRHFEKRGPIVPQLTYPEFTRLASSKGALNDKYIRFNQHDRLTDLNGKRVLVWDKNLVFFPRRINGSIYFLHRIKPDIQIASVLDLSELSPEFWQHYCLHFGSSIVLSPCYAHEVSYVGGGCPPLETSAGWLLIYHGVHDTVQGYVYTACAALLSLDNPAIEIARLPYPLFSPQYDWEITGEVNNVCFPTGTVVRDDTLYIYYGAADSQIACASVQLQELISELLLNPHGNANDIDCKTE
ncbi:MAG TPA: pesticidal protein Cry7Aa, partial [Bacteroidia bacterium]|nr:pesticidal protein Cry7Aa [Bacteroidia bacterium]